MLDGSVTLMNQLQKMWKNEIKGCFVQSMIFTVVLILTENKLQYITLKKKFTDFIYAFCTIKTICYI